jgi:hypothetical protein
MSVSLYGSGQTVVQTAQTLITTGTFTTTSTSMTNLTGMAVSITPLSTSDKILISVSFVYGFQDNYCVGIQLLRNGTPVGIGTSGTTGPNYTFATSPAGNNTPTSCNWTYLDSPATTSAITYQIQVRLQAASGGTFALNFANGYLNAGSDVYQGCYTSTITAQEIAYV